MLFTQDRRQLRSFFAEAWRKQRAGMPMEPMEAIAADIIGRHPELEPVLAEPDALEQDFRADRGEGNPFLHLSLHVAVHEQVAADRPPGVRAVYQALLRKLQDPHDVEHALMECLIESLWEAMQGQRQPDERVYLECLRGRKGVSR
jgi:hypothetical protein